MPIPVKQLSVKPFKEALGSLKLALAEPKSDIVRDSVIQRFEYTFELSWKMLKRYFEANNSLSEDNVKNLFREAGKQGLIDSVESWFEYLDARNLSSHTYSIRVAEQVFTVASRFAVDAQGLLTKLESLLG